MLKSAKHKSKLANRKNMTANKAFGNVFVLIIKQLSVIRFPLSAFRCPLSAVRCSLSAIRFALPTTDILCQFSLSSSELSLHWAISTIGDCRVSIIDCQLAFCLLAQLFINLVKIPCMHIDIYTYIYIFIYTRHKSFIFGRQFEHNAGIFTL